MKQFSFVALSLFALALFLPSLASAATTTVSGTITTNTTWTLASSTFIVTADVTVNPGVTLTIQPGVVVKFNGLNSIINKGTLNAVGNATNTIYFTSYKDDTVGGDTNANGASVGVAADWSAIKTDLNATSTIKYAELRFSTNGFYNTGGSLTLATTTSTSSSAYGLWSEFGTTTASNSLFNNNRIYGVFVGNTGSTGSGSFSMASSSCMNNGKTDGGVYYGLYARGSAALSLVNNNFATNTTAGLLLDYGNGGPNTFTHSANKAWGNPDNAILLANIGSLTGSKTWSSDTIPYVISGAATINPGYTLTITSGAVIKFLDNASSLTNSGTINVQGSTSSPVYFTSFKDDVLNDTNNNGGTNIPNNGDWVYLKTSAGTSTIDHAIIRYGGGVNGDSLLNIYGGNLTISNSEVASSSSYGFLVDNNGVVSVSYTDVHHNGTSTNQTYFGYKHLKGTTTIDHSTFRNNSNYGVQCDIGAAGGNMFLTNNIFTNSGGGAVFIGLAINLNLVHSNNSATGTGKGGIVLSGAPAVDQNWSGDPLLPYIISSATGTITSTKNITVGAGAIFKFEGATANLFENSGTFTADSSASTSKIYFTSIKDDTVGGDTNGNGSANSPAAGDWDTLKISGSAVIKNAVIRYGGNSVTGSSKMLWNNGGTINLNNVEIATSSVYGMYDTNTFSTLNATSTTIHHNMFGYGYGGGVARIANNGNTIYSNSVYGISNSSGTTLNAEQIYWPASTTGQTMNGPYSTSTNPAGHGDAVLPTFIDFDPWVSTVSGNIATNTTWTASSTYVIDGVVVVNSGTTLTIPAATVVKFKDISSRLYVSGTLIADSAATSTKIYFTSYKDDTVGGDTNSDGSATSPAAGDWDGIRIGTTGTATLANLVLRYAGYTGGASKSIWNLGGSLTGKNITVATGTTYGIYSDGGLTNILASDVTAHAYGLYRADGTIYAQSNSIHGNTSYGFYNASTTNNCDARYNYWGASDGPHNLPLYFGSGDNISDHVNANSYLDKMHYLNFWNGAIQTSVQTKVIKWAWYNATSSYANAWYAGVGTWNTYGSSVVGVSIATSTTGSTTAYLVVQDIATSSSDYFLAAYDHNPTPQLIKFNPYYMNTSTTSVKILSATHELGHALGLGHSYLGNIMLSYATSTGQTALGTQDMLDYDYLNANIW